MISFYNPTLRKPSNKSSDWYKNFHNYYYLSQITNLALTSYVETQIHFTKNQMIEELKDELLKKKIIYKEKETGDIKISKKDALKSVHVEETLNEIIDKVIIDRQNLIRVCLLGMHLNPSARDDKELEINIDHLLKTTSSKNWYETLLGLLNSWEFLFLYGVVESTLKKY